MKKIRTIVVALATLVLTACGGSNPKADDFELKIIAPKGAPSLAFYDKAADANFVTSDGAHIKSEFGQKNYGMVVMEFYTGLRTIKKSNSNYRLARVLTGGNLYLVSRSGKTTAPTADDTVIAFGPGGTKGVPYLSLTTLYPEVNPDNIVMLEDGAAVQGALISGTYTGKNGNEDKTIDVDYVVIPQPALAGALKKLESNEQVKPKIISGLREKANEVSNGEQKWVLQAGLFVHKDLYSEHKEIFDEELAQIDKNIDTILETPEVCQQTIDELLPNKDEQKLKFSCPTEMIPKISKNPKTPNGFGFIPAEEWNKIDVQSFLTFLGEEGPENNYTEYMLEK